MLTPDQRPAWQLGFRAPATFRKLGICEWLDTQKLLQGVEAEGILT